MGGRLLLHHRPSQGLSNLGEMEKVVPMLFEGLGVVIAGGGVLAVGGKTGNGVLRPGHEGLLDKLSGERALIGGNKSLGEIRCSRPGRDTLVLR